MQLSLVAPHVALYVAPAADGQLTSLYFVPQTPPAGLPQNLQFQDSWNLPQWTGWYVFLASALDDGDAADFVAAALQNLPPLSSVPNERGLFWVSYAETWESAVGWTCNASGLGTPIPRSLNEPVTLHWSGFGLNLGNLTLANSVAITYAAATGNTPDQLIVSAGANAIQLLYYGNPPPFVSGDGWQIAIALQDFRPLGGSQPFVAGTLAFSRSLDFVSLAANFGCCFSYFYGANPPSQLSYPFLAVTSSPNQPEYLPFVVVLHPLLPTTAQCTFFGLNGLAQQLSSQYFATASGKPAALTSALNLTNFPYAGFAFSVRPSAASPHEPELYLSPCGPWNINTIDGSSPVIWMMGLFTQEYLSVIPGAFLLLVPNQPAYASSLQSPPEQGDGQPAASSPPSQIPLDGTYTTSWIQFQNPTFSPAYFGQPSASVYYSPVAGKQFPLALDAQLAGVIPANAMFPAVPYMGLSASEGDPAIMQALESSALSTTRHAVLIPPGEAPQFQVQSQFQVAEAMEQQSGPTDAMTPQGFVAKLNPGGSWGELFLATGSDSTQLSISGTGTPPQVPPVLASTLLQNDLFLVVSNAEGLGQFQNQITIEDFTFSIDVAAGSSILVFKFNSSVSLADMINQPALWADTADFVGDTAAVAAAQQQILDAIAAAAATGGPFANFNSIVQMPSWTGVLAFNCGIEGGSMPLSLQLLLGGISGALKAHHLGIQSNRVVPRSPGGLEIAESSLFGVIDYQAPPASPTSGGGTPPDFDYEVLQLIVVFSNSKITQFHTTVGLTINQLFGRALELAPSASPPPVPNTLQITGQFQEQNGVPGVSFFSHTPTTFRFVRPAGYSRVLHEIVINQASLTPVSRTGSPDPRIVANFALGGQLWFSQDPFPNADIDLFSYGNAAASPTGSGAAFSGLNLTLAFTLNADGQLIPNSKTVTQTGLLTLAPTPECIRPGSLLGNLPLKLTGIQYSAAGLSPSSTGAYPVHCLQLEGGSALGASSGSPSSPPMPALPQSPYTTTSPTYALEFDMPLGSLGALSDVHVGLVAKLLIGWGPSPLVPQNDACGLMVQLPSLTAGYKGFNLQGIIGTKFGDANLLKVVLPGEPLPVYAILFNNVQLSVFGFGFPPGLMTDFLLFAGPPASGGVNTNTNNLAWFLGAYQTGGSPS